MTSEEIESVCESANFAAQQPCAVGPTLAESQDAFWWKIALGGGAGSLALILLLFWLRRWRRDRWSAEKLDAYDNAKAAKMKSKKENAVRKRGGAAAGAIYREPAEAAGVIEPDGSVLPSDVELGDVRLDDATTAAAVPSSPRRSRHTRRSPQHRHSSTSTAAAAAAVSMRPNIAASMRTTIFTENHNELPSSRTPKRKKHKHAHGSKKKGKEHTDSCASTQDSTANGDTIAPSSSSSIGSHMASNGSVDGVHVHPSARPNHESWRQNYPVVTRVALPQEGEEE